jgi:hypothetical protein
MKHLVAALVFVLAVAVGAPCQEGLTIGLSPAADIPLGPTTESGLNRLSFGGSVALQGAYVFPSLSYVGPAGDLKVSIYSTSASTSLTTIYAGLGAVVPVFDTGLVSATARATGGYTGIIYDGGLYNSLGFRAGLELGFTLTGGFSLGLTGSYEWVADAFPNPLTYGFSVGLNAGFNLGGSGQTRLRIEEPQLNPVFPVFHAYYNEHPIGVVQLTNDEPVPISNVLVQFVTGRFMDEPKVCARVPLLARGASVDVPILALFSNEILQVTERTIVPGKLQISYERQGEVIAVEHTTTVHVENRNAMTWDDDEKAAAFVTAFDPMIVRLAKSTAALIRNHPIPAVSESFRQALALYESLRMLNISYVRDPSTPYDVLYQDEAAVDYLQFPVQTLVYQGGDCDDLSILYSALLEAIGVPTAFLPVPGHIYVAFDTGLPTAEAVGTFATATNFIELNGNAWVPVEITLLEEDFFEAWSTGATEWRRATADGTEGMHVVRTAQATYAAVGYNTNETIIDLPDSDELRLRFSDELSGFVYLAVQSRVGRLEDRLATVGNNAEDRNRLGTVYARYGLIDEALAQFTNPIATTIAAACVNAAQCYMIKQEFGPAASYFGRAIELEPENPAAHIGLARASYSLGDPAATEESYRAAVVIDESLAPAFAYLVSESEARASDQAGPEFTWLD